MSKDSLACWRANLLQVCYWSSPPRPIAFTIAPFSWRARSSLACVYKIVYLPMRLLCRPKQMKNPIHLPWNYRYLPKQITRGPLRMDSLVLGSIAVYICFGFLCIRDFSWEVSGFGQVCFKIVTCALSLRPTPNYPSKSKLRDRRRICLFFREKGEFRGRARRESVFLVHSVKLTNKLTGATPHATKSLRLSG